MSGIDEPAPRSHYHFRISLRVRHPSVAPEKITEAVGSECDSNAIGTERWAVLARPVNRQVDGIRSIGVHYENLETAAA